MIVVGCLVKLLTLRVKLLKLVVAQRAASGFLRLQERPCRVWEKLQQRYENAQDQRG
jgi:hypothetical protein